MNIKESKKNKKGCFDSYVNLYLKRCMIRNKESTYSSYYYVINSRILPYYSGLEIKKITSDSVTKYANYLMAKGLSNKTIKDTLTILYGILKLYNKKIEVIYPKIMKKEVKILKECDQLLLETYLVNNLNSISFGIYLSLYTGLRIGEVCALKWSDIDSNKITINNTVVRVIASNKKRKTKLVIANAKSISSIREIPLSNNMKKLIEKLNGINPSHYILSGTSKFMDPRTFYNKYKKILNELNINNYNFHTLRHTFATKCIEKGADPKTLSLILGHSSVKITLDRYVHPDFNNKVNLMNNLEHLYKL